MNEINDENGINEENDQNPKDENKAEPEKRKEVPRSKKEKLKSRIMELLDEFYIGEKTYNRITHKILNAIKVFIAASKKFISDDSLTKASSIAYTTIISLIPTLTVGLTFFSLGMRDKKEELFAKVSQFMLEHNIKLDIDPFIEAITGLIENAEKIGGIGAIVLIFSATAVLRTLEKSLNDIFQVKKRRPLFLKMIFYWAALTLGPLMLITGTTVATQISTIFSSPNYTSACMTDKNVLWVVGNKAAIQYTDDQSYKLKEIKLSSIDFDNQRVMKYEPKEMVFKVQEYRLEDMDFKKAKFSDIQFIDNYGWIVSEEGLILYTHNSGRSWSLTKWGDIIFKDIHMINSREGFIAAEKGILLKTDDRGRTWSVVNLNWPGLAPDLKSIDFSGKKGIIAATKGTLLSTDDSGKTWDISQINEAKRKKRYINLNHVEFINDWTIWLSCDEGMILMSDNSGKTWNVKKFLEGNYYSSNFSSREKGFVGGENGLLIYTETAGEKWKRQKLPTPRINIIYSDNSSLWVFGNNGMIMKSTDNGATWKGRKGRNFFVFVLNFFAPFIFIWLLFLLTYLLLPNMKVPFKAAAIGAAFTGTVWVIFILGFIVYIKAFAKGTLAIYGALAAFPIFLLMVYASSVIVLYGAEVSYTLMHPHTYLRLKKALKDKKDIHVFYGISILVYIYSKFEKGKGATDHKELLKTLANNSEEVDFFLDLFLKENIIINKSEQGFIPANTSGNILIADIIDMIHDISLEVPVQAAPIGSLKKHMSTIFSDMKDSRKKIVGEKTLKGLIEEIGA